MYMKSQFYVHVTIWKQRVYAKIEKVKKHGFYYAVRKSFTQISDTNGSIDEVYIGQNQAEKFCTFQNYV